MSLSRANTFCHAIGSVHRKKYHFIIFVTEKNVFSSRRNMYKYLQVVSIHGWFLSSLRQNCLREASYVQVGTATIQPTNHYACHLPLHKRICVSRLDITSEIKKKTGKEEKKERENAKKSLVNDRVVPRQ